MAKPRSNSMTLRGAAANDFVNSLMANPKPAPDLCLCRKHPMVAYPTKETCPACERDNLRAMLRCYVADEDRFNRGEGEPFGSIPTDLGIAARRAVKA